jgi:hypothetical protein
MQFRYPGVTVQLQSDSVSTVKQICELFCILPSPHPLGIIHQGDQIVQSDFHWFYFEKIFEIDRSG